MQLQQPSQQLQQPKQQHQPLQHHFQRQLQQVMIFIYETNIGTMKTRLNYKSKVFFEIQSLHSRVQWRL